MVEEFLCRDVRLLSVVAGFSWLFIYFELYIFILF